jgi:hypothetical protein
MDEYRKKRSQEPCGSSQGGEVRQDPCQDHCQLLDGDDSNRGQNAFFYDAAEGLLTSVILMLAEFLAAG